MSIEDAKLNERPPALKSITNSMHRERFEDMDKDKFLNHIFTKTYYLKPLVEESFIHSLGFAPFVLGEFETSDGKTKQIGPNRSEQIWVSNIDEKKIYFGNLNLTFGRKYKVTIYYFENRIL